MRLLSIIHLETSMKLESSLVTIVLVCFLNGTKGQQQGFRVCKDSYRDCRMWYQAGMCHTSSFKQFINNGCPKTCGLCTDRMLIPPQEQPQGADWSHSNHRGEQQPFGTKINPKKVDPKLLSKHYPFLPEQGSVLQDKTNFLKQQSRDPMFKFSKYLADNGTANTTITTNTSTAQQNNCTDIFIKCGKWKEEEICKDFKLREYLKYGCAKTCKFCNCRDMYREAPYCAEWKNKGFCDTFPGQMDSYCPKTCLLCGDSVAPPTMGQHPLPAPTGIPPINPGYRLKTDQPYEDTRIFKAKKPLTFLVNEKLQRQPIMKVMQSLRKKRLVGGNEIPLPNDVGFGQTLDRPASKPKPALQTPERADNSIFSKLKDHTGNIQDHFQKLDKNIAEEFSLANKDQYNEIEGYPIADDFDEQGSEDVETAAVREHDKDQKGPSDYNTYVDAERKFQGMNGGSDYYFDRYSKDPDLAASQQLEQQQLMAETGEKFAYGRSNFDLPLNQLHRKLNDAAKNANHLHHRKKANDIKVSHKRH